MAIAIYEPPPLEIKITLALGLTVLSPYYQGFASSLKLHGDERVLDFGQVFSALVRKLRLGGRLLLREPAGEGLELTALRSLASSAGLHPSTLEMRRTLIGTVMDGIFTKNNQV